MVNSCTLHKMLLVVFFHHRALLLLPQLSHSTNTGLSRSSFSCLGQGDMECTAMACINYKAHVSCFQTQLRSLYYLCVNQNSTNTIFFFKHMGKTLGVITLILRHESKNPCRQIYSFAPFCMPIMSPSTLKTSTNYLFPDFFLLSV